MCDEDIASQLKGLPLLDIETSFPTTLPEPKYQLEVPPSGWFKAPQSLAGHTVWARVDERLRLATIGLHVAGIGHVMTHDETHGFIADAVLGQVAPVPIDQLREVAQQLVTVGLWAKCEYDGLPGYVVGGAREAVAGRKARKISAQVAGAASQAGRDPRTRTTIKGQLLADQPVDWSKVGEDL